MPTEQVGHDGDRGEHDRQHRIEAPSADLQQHGVGGFVDGEAARRQQQETLCRGADRGAMAAETQQVVASEGHAEGHQPTDHVGHQRRPAGQPHQRDDDAPVHAGRGATDQQEPADAAALTRPAGGGLSRTVGVGVQPVHAAPEHNEARTICICLDDFGLHEGINQAAIALVEAGRVQALSCMVGAPAWPTGLAALRALHPAQVDIGLHLDLTETPLLAGSRRPLKALIAGAWLGRLDLRAVHAEIQAQLDAFAQALGRLPAYIDGHQHVHQFPGVRDELLAELEGRCRGAVKPWLRSTRARRGPAAGNGGFKRRVIESLGARGLAERAERLRYPQNRHLLGVYDFHPDAGRYAGLLAQWLAAADDGDLLMCHAGLDDRAGTLSDSIGAARSAEFQVLAGDSFLLLLHEQQIRLLPMSRILAKAPRSA